MHDDGASPSAVNDAEETYELDMDSESPEEVDEVLEQALEAVERRRTRREEEPAEPEQGDGDDPREAAVAKLKDQLARTLADFDNFRKRTEREKAELKKVAAGEVLKDMLPVIDNLERAVAAGGSVDELKKGLDMVLRQQADALARWGVKPVAAVGEPFDPSVHEAVGREESPDVDGPTVSSELQRGYTIHDRLLRPAMVFVTMPGGAKAASGAGGDRTDD